MTENARNSEDEEPSEYGALLPPERRWVVNQELLERHGYLLRPRYRPGWVPSWKNTNKVPDECEDFHINLHRRTIDATRVSDGSPVFIKKILEYDSNEVSIAQFLTSEDKINNPRNHCVPVLDVVTDPSLEHWSFIVMPVLRRFDDPPFFSVDEVLDFMKQTLIGLSFMHQHGVAHRDASNLNIMMDSTEMYPKGFHPNMQLAEPDFKRLAKPRRRRDVSSVKYYFTDFGISSRFTDPNKPRLVLGGECQDKEVPELSCIRPYDPFKVDIFTLGNLYRHEFLEKYDNLLFLLPLVAAMVQKDPSARPSANEALSKLEELVTAQPGYKKRWRLKASEQNKIIQFFMDLGSARRECILLMKSLWNTRSFLSPMRRSGSNTKGVGDCPNSL